MRLDANVIVHAPSKGGAPGCGARGVVYALDVQQEMLEAIGQRGRAAGVISITGCVGDAS